jgi:hypothetical protein
MTRVASQQSSTSSRIMLKAKSCLRTGGGSPLRRLGAKLRHRRHEALNLKSVHGEALSSQANGISVEALAEDPAIMCFLPGRRGKPQPSRSTFCPLKRQRPKLLSSLKKVAKGGIDEFSVCLSEMVLKPLRKQPLKRVKGGNASAGVGHSPTLTFEMKVVNP